MDTVQRRSRNHTAVAALCLFFAVGGIFAAARGPRLGEHETIVAQSARQMLQTGNWIVPHYLDMPFLMKPPLSPWLVAIASAILPGDPATGSPVTTLTARLPSVVATSLTIWVVYLLALSALTRRQAVLAAVIFATSAGSLLFAVNATAEALLTFLCTWSIAEFWWAHRAASRSRRRLHLARFYVALGLAMLAKGPMPIIVVVAPLVAWWFLHRPFRMLARVGARRFTRATAMAFREAPKRLLCGMSELGLWWGVPLVLAVFVPWMVLVARREPYAWDLWSYEYLDRLAGHYPGSRSGRWFYYVPLAFALLSPWCLSLPQAIAAPLRTVRRRGMGLLTLAWFAVFVALVALSVQSFKKPYYLLPVVPSLAILLAPVVDDFLSPRRAAGRRGAALVALGVVAVLAAGLVAGAWQVQRDATLSVSDELLRGGTILALGLVIMVALAVGLSVRGLRSASVVVLGIGFPSLALAGWCLVGPVVGVAKEPLALAQRLDELDVAATSNVLWASNRPDGRVSFYGGRTVRHIVDPYELASRSPQIAGAADHREDVAERLIALFEAPTPVFVVFQRADFVEFAKRFDGEPEVLFAIDRASPGEDRHDWIVATNAPLRPGGIEEAMSSPWNGRAGGGAPTTDMVEKMNRLSGGKRRELVPSSERRPGKRAPMGRAALRPSATDGVR